MKRTIFAFVIGGATILAMILTMLIPTSCSYNEEANSVDWYVTHYGECVDMCAAAREWGMRCEHPEMAGDCVERLWYYWTEPHRCELAAGCYRALTLAEDCREGVEHFIEAGWQPPTWQSGCPVK